MSMTSWSYFAGIDWASRAHAVCVLNSAGETQLRIEVQHSKEGIERLIRQLKSFPGIVIAIERPSGLLVDALIEAGLRVVPIHPNVLKASRARYHGAGKSDPGDAYMLADLLRTDGHRFRALEPQSDDIRALRALVRTRDDLVDQRVALANQLRSLLESFWPGAAEIFADVDSPIALAFISRYPTPQSAARLGEKRLAGFLAQHSYCGRRPVAALLERLRAASPGAPASSKPKPKASSPQASRPSLSAWSLSCSSSPLASSTPWPAWPTARSSCLSRARAVSAPPKSLPSWAACASASPAKRSSLPRQVSLP
jgi:hypothetical protein